MKRGALFGLLAAALFGVSTPLAKRLLPGAGPLVLAGLFYLGAALGLFPFRVRARGSRREAPITRADAGLLAGIVAAGGVIGPVLMLVGLGRLSAAAGSLLLNLETPLTIFLAVAAFGEHLERRAAAGALLVVAGAALLGIGPGLHGDLLGALAIAGACLAWALDNNLTQRLSLRDPVAVVRIKTGCAGLFTLTLALVLGQPLPSPTVVGVALAVGVVSYGLSLILHVHALRILGTAREAAYFATAPFLGALAAVPIAGARLGPGELGAAALMAVGVALLLAERHGHPHSHERLEHEHAHVHDEHHQHVHDGPIEEPHSHRHVHEPLTHTHPHTPDSHHRHRH